MGPLVPDIIGNELNLIAALLIGFAFGFILEQAGFSTSKKLVGLFYGYDFTVLRVFFTAGITAMFGVILLGHFGLLDGNLIYINPTFLTSAIIGGLIMGVGFVVGGFCPGTSIAAAAVGKIDAMIFIIGSVIGVAIFALFYPALEGLYKADYWGEVTVFQTLGISQGLAAFGMVVMAISAFWFTTLVENKVNGKSNPEFIPVKLYVVFSLIVLAIGSSSFAFPDRKVEYLNNITDTNYVEAYSVNRMTIDELSFRLIDEDNNLQIIDLRESKGKDSLSLPNSVSYSLNDLFGKDISKLLGAEGKKNLFVGEEEIDGKKGSIIADKLGYENVYFLEGGLKKFRNDIINFIPPERILTRQEKDTYRFRAKARTLIPALIDKGKSKKVIKETSKRIIGGC